MGAPKTIANTLVGGLKSIQDAGRIAHEKQAAKRAETTARVLEHIKNLPPRAKSTMVEMGQYHPVGGGAKLSKPFEMMHVTKVPDPEYKQPGIRTVTPEDLVKERAAIYPLFGDRADTGNYLTHIGENELSEPVRMTGGSRYMDANFVPENTDLSAAWESGKGVVGKLSSRGRMAAEMDRQPVGMYVAGSGENTDFNIMGARAVLNQLHTAKFTKKAQKAFDAEMKAQFPQWKGLLSPDTEHMLLDKGNGQLRTIFMQTMGMAPHQKAGLPDIPHTRKAITDEALMDVPTNQAGFRIASMSPEGRIIEQPKAPSDYPLAMAGNVMGTLDKPMDMRNIWTDHFEGRRLLSQPESGDYYSLNRATPIQIADQEWLDKVMHQRREMERKEREGKYKEGGLAHLGRGGQPNKKKTTVAQDIMSFKEPATAMADIGAGGLRATVAGLLDLPSDIESIGRGAHAAYKAPSGQRLEALAAGLEQPTTIPAYGKKLPPAVPESASDSRKHSAEFGEDFGQFADVPLGKVGLKAASYGLGRAAGTAAKHAGQAVSDAMIHQTGPLSQGPLSMLAPKFAVSHVVKPKGGNFLTGSVEKSVADLKRPDRQVGGRRDPREALDEMRATYSPEAIENLAPALKDHVQQVFQDLEKKIAVNDWVDRNLTGYIKKEMGTPEDPVRALFERRTQEIEAKYAKDMEKSSRLEQRAQGEQDPRRAANFMRESQQVAADAAAERDLTMKHIAHFPSNEVDYANMWIPERLGLQRFNAGYPAVGMGKSNAAKAWESISDQAIYGNTAESYRQPLTPSEIRQGYKSVVDDNPWLSKLDPQTMVYRPEGTPQDLGFDHVLDVLRQDVAAGRIRPEQLNKVSVDQAVQRAAEYDQELAAKMNAQRAAAREGLPVHKEYPEGYKWIELNKPGSFNAESEAMGHSVKGYEPPVGHPDWVEESGDFGSLSYGHGGWEGIKSGDAKVYSLVNKKGEPHVTVEVKSGKPWNERSGIFYDNPELEPSWQKFSQEASLEEKAKGLDRPSNYIERYPEWLKVNDPEMYAKHINVFEQSPPNITQIKGKSNRAPKEEYLPYVHDFVKGGKWSDVGDLYNTGLIHHSGKYFTEPELIEAAKKYGRMGVQDTPWEVARQRHIDAGVPEDEALRNWVEAFKEGRGRLELPPEDGMKDGGVAHMGAGGLLAKGLKKGVTHAVKHPEILVPGHVSNLEHAMRQSAGEYGAKRVQRAADEIPNLERLYKKEALERAFMGDNAKAVMTLKPQDFERYATPLTPDRNWSPGDGTEGPSKHTMPTAEYIRHLANIQGGFDDVPFFSLNKDEVGLPLVPFISGHEGRHRSRALAEMGQPTSLVQMIPYSELREPFPRRTHEAYLDALKKEMEMTNNMVVPQQQRGKNREAIELPDMYAEGGSTDKPKKKEEAHHDEEDFSPSAWKRLEELGYEIKRPEPIDHVKRHADSLDEMIEKIKGHAGKKAKQIEDEMRAALI